VRVLGLISGTSFDAIEVAAADLTAEGEELTLRPLGGLSVPYAPDLARAIAAALPPAATTAEVICSLGSDRPSVVDLLATLTHLTATTVTRATCID
jgi:anhydro-N-acetylmuramic acid kinase